MTNQVKITPSVLKAQVEKGMKLKALAEHYSINEPQMKNALKALGLKIKKTRQPAFIFVNEELELPNETFTEEQFEKTVINEEDENFYFMKEIQSQEVEVEEVAPFL